MEAIRNGMLLAKVEIQCIGYIMAKYNIQLTRRGQRNWTHEEDVLIFKAANNGDKITDLLSKLDSRSEKALRLRLNRRGFSVIDGVLKIPK